MSDNKDTSKNEQDTADMQGLQENSQNPKSEKGDPIDFNEYSKEELVELLRAHRQRIEELELQVEELKDARLRKVAELENFRKRVQRERTQVYETAKANALEDFLSINDDLRRTLKASEDAEVDQNFLDGVQMVADKFDEVLRKHGVVRIDQEMVPFDVDLHDAMMRQKPQDESVESDMVLSVIENGYRIGDRTIRHAKVIVSE